jgi:anti-anti-sigma factor
MSALELPPVSADDFSASASLDGDTLTVRFSGNADMRTKSALDALLVKVHSEAQRLAVREVVINFHSLEFMNSSCFKSFVSWISDVRDLDVQKQYKIRFLSKPELLWQRRSLHALRCFAVDLISIDG